MEKLILIVLYLCFSLSVGLARESVVHSKLFSLSLPEDWRFVEDLFGLPHVVLGPKKLNKRPTLSVVPSEDDQIILDGELPKTGVEVYQLRRKLWVEEHEGQVLRFFPYQKMKSNHLDVIHRFGFEYVLGTEKFTEHSIYFYCGKKLFNIKTLSLIEDMQGQYQLEEIIKSFRCK